MIEITNLYKSFKDQPVLRGVNLSIPKGKITVIIGPSGCGKTSLLRHIIGLLKPDSGRVVVDGTDINRLDAMQLNDFRKRFGMLFQNAALFDSMNVFENIAFPLKEHSKKTKGEIEKIVAEKLKLVGLEKAQEKMPSELSGGMKKRAGLARAIALEPEIILYDEPTTGLDPIMTEAIDNLILETQKKLHITSVVISHDIPSSFHIGDRIAMVDQGKIVAVGTPDEMRKSDNKVVQAFLEKGALK
ncbi:MAG: ABC transporter ATP-binding protein [Deltaproteobacteria bacterium]|nr:ABC transporter ATP-binding protein [Deltaproteobacteria bacterium]